MIMLLFDKIIVLVVEKKLGVKKVIFSAEALCNVDSRAPGTIKCGVKNFEKYKVHNNNKNLRFFQPLKIVILRCFGYN